jgi:hypothetical protein
MVFRCRFFVLGCLFSLYLPLAGHATPPTISNYQGLVTIRVWLSKG